MEATITNHQKNVSTFIHLSTFSKWFFPFGNFIAPLVLWSAQKSKSAYIDKNSREAINFQLSMLLYLIIIAVITIPFVVYQAIKYDGSTHIYWSDHLHANGDASGLSGLLIALIVSGTLAIGLTLFEIVTVISAAIKASKGESYSYPLTIRFITDNAVDEIHQTTTEEPAQTAGQASDNSTQTTASANTKNDSDKTNDDIVL
ncbi:MAG: hypothetical protein CL867_02715 [Cytophagaceae bacterium]|nr:hypothetical protein [Cytophagaceae bacterium]